MFNLLTLTGLIVSHLAWGSKTIAGNETVRSGTCLNLSLRDSLGAKTGIAGEKEMLLKNLQSMGLNSRELAALQKTRVELEESRNLYESCGFQGEIPGEAIGCAHPGRVILAKNLSQPRGYLLHELFHQIDSHPVSEKLEKIPCARNVSQYVKDTCGHQTAKTNCKREIFAESLTAFVANPTALCLEARKLIAAELFGGKDNYCGKVKKDFDGNAPSLDEIARKENTSFYDNSQGRSTSMPMGTDLASIFSMFSSMMPLLNQPKAAQPVRPQDTPAPPAPPVVPLNMNGNRVGSGTR